MELEELDRRTRKLMTVYGAHHPKASVDWLYLQRCEGGRGLHIHAKTLKQLEKGIKSIDFNGSFRERPTSGTGDNEWQRMRMIGTMSDSEWQPVTTNDNK